MDRVNKDYEDKMNNNFKRIEPVLCKKIMDYIVQPILLNDQTFKTRALKVSESKVILFIFLLILKKKYVEIIINEMLKFATLDAFDK